MTRHLFPRAPAACRPHGRHGLDGASAPLGTRTAGTPLAMLASGAGGSRAFSMQRAIRPAHGNEKITPSVGDHPPAGGFGNEVSVRLARTVGQFALAFASCVTTISCSEGPRDDLSRQKPN